MEKDILEERLIRAWINLTGALKNTRITQGMIYNEAIVMNLVYAKYREDGEGLISFKELVSETRMLKSLVNRTIDALVEKKYLARCAGKDKRTTFVKPVEENLPVYLAVHEKTLEMVKRIVALVGVDDAEAFYRVAAKIAEADPLNT